MKKIKGKPVSSGIVIGKALIFNSKAKIVLREKITTGLVDTEIKRLNNAVRKTRSQLKKIFQDLQKVMGKDSAFIIETQNLLLKEGNLVTDIKNVISKNAVRSEWAIKQIEKKYMEYFENIPDLSFREKRNDISDVLNRLITNLKDSSNQIDTKIENVILVAPDIQPSIAANLMSQGKLLGLVLEEGGETSHTVILARTLEIPTILDAQNATQLIANDDDLVVDGLNGEIIINPSESNLVKTSIKQDKYKLHKERLKEVVKLPNLTKDRHAFHLMANIEFDFESDTVESYGAQGIGLFRTEFLFTDPNVALSEDRQQMIYKNIAQKMFPKPVVIRTFDVGRDKTNDYFKEENESNPALGTMGIRLFLKERDLFKIQLKSIIMANESGNIKILFPMITEMEEIHTIKTIIEEVKEDLQKRSKLPNQLLELGVMIEIPGSVKLIKHLQKEVDFFSIGTNDLMQYLLAVDRNNNSVSYLSSPFQPSVIEILKEIYLEIEKTGKEVVVCGEIAGKSLTALMLLGIGFTHFSMNPLALTEIKRIFTNIHLSYLKKIMKKTGELGSRNEIEEFLIETLVNKYPDLLTQQPIY